MMTTADFTLWAACASAAGGLWWALVRFAGWVADKSWDLETERRQ